MTENIISDFKRSEIYLVIPDATRQTLVIFEIYVHTYVPIYFISFFKYPLFHEKII